MALQASGAISLNDISTEFGGDTPHSLSEYYRGGTYVGTNNSTVPESGAIDFADFYSTTAAMVLNVSANTSNYNVKTSAVAAGLTDGSGVPIIVNVSAIVTGSGDYAMQTGDLDNSHDITININSGGQIDGYTGTTAGPVAGTGGAGGDAIYWNSDTGGSPTHIVNLNSGGYLRGGGGGGGGGGQRGGRQGLCDDGKGNQSCCGSVLYGSYGTNGAAGAFGAAGASGGGGGWGAGSNSCVIQHPGGGGSGGAAGYALRKNSRTVTLNNSGTLAGTVG